LESQSQKNTNALTGDKKMATKKKAKKKVAKKKTAKKSKKK